jgi:RPA family protein
MTLENKPGISDSKELAKMKEQLSKTGAIFLFSGKYQPDDPDTEESESEYKK